MKVLVLLLAWDCPGGTIPAIKLGILLPLRRLILPVAFIHPFIPSPSPFICSFMYPSIRLFRKPLSSACSEPVWSAVLPFAAGRVGGGQAAGGAGRKGCGSALTGLFYSAASGPWEVPFTLLSWLPHL